MNQATLARRLTLSVFKSKRHNDWVLCLCPISKMVSLLTVEIRSTFHKFPLSGQIIWCFQMNVIPRQTVHHSHESLVLYKFAADHDLPFVWFVTYPWFKSFDLIMTEVVGIEPLTSLCKYCLIYLSQTAVLQETAVVIATLCTLGTQPRTANSCWLFSKCQWPSR